MSDIQLHNADCLEVLRTLAADSIDSFVTDPPAGISFMNRPWDGNKGGRKQWIEWLSIVMGRCLRVLSPGACGLVWALPRTSHWTATALEDAGFEIRDVIHHLFGQGFPKAKSCLKPAAENWILIRKPGKMQPLQIDECRIAGAYETRERDNEGGKSIFGLGKGGGAFVPASGRWPANVVLSHRPECNGECHPDCPVRLLDEQSGERKSGGCPPRRKADSQGYMKGWNGNEETSGVARSVGGASRFFYTSKASRSDRGEGNTHPTVKSTSLMSWLVKLVTPPGGIVLDCFAGSGSTMVACLQTGRRGIGIEISPEYFAIAQNRIAAAQAQSPLFATQSEIAS